MRRVFLTGGIVDACGRVAKNPMIRGWVPCGGVKKMTGERHLVDTVVGKGKVGLTTCRLGYMDFNAFHAGASG